MWARPHLAASATLIGLSGCSLLFDPPARSSSREDGGGRDAALLDGASADGSGAGDASAPDARSGDGTGFSGPPPTLYWTFDDADVPSDFTVSDTGSEAPDVTGAIGEGITRPAGQVGKSAAFPGGSVGSAVTGDGDLPESDTFTISLWMKPTSFPGGGEPAQRAVNMGTPSSSSMESNRGWGIAVSDQEIGFFIFAGGLERIRTGPTHNNPVPEGQWVHIVGVMDASIPVMKLYRNGSLTGQKQPSSASIDFADPAASFLLGYHAKSESRFYIGELDEVAVWNGEVLTDAEIMELHQLGEDAEGLNPP